MQSRKIEVPSSRPSVFRKTWKSRTQEICPVRVFNRYYAIGTNGKKKSDPSRHFDSFDMSATKTSCCWQIIPGWLMIVGMEAGRIGTIKTEITDPRQRAGKGKKGRLMNWTAYCRLIKWRS